MRSRTCSRSGQGRTVRSCSSVETRLADQQSAHRVSVPVGIPSSGISSGGSYGKRRAAATSEAWAFDGVFQSGFLIWDGRRASTGRQPVLIWRRARQAQARETQPKNNSCVIQLQTVTMVLCTRLMSSVIRSGVESWTCSSMANGRLAKSARSCKTSSASRSRVSHGIFACCATTDSPASGLKAPAACTPSTPNLCARSTRG